MQSNFNINKIYYINSHNLCVQKIGHSSLRLIVTIRDKKKWSSGLRVRSLVRITVAEALHICKEIDRLAEKDVEEEENETRSVAEQICVVVNGRLVI